VEIDHIISLTIKLDNLIYWQKYRRKLSRFKTVQAIKTSNLDQKKGLMVLF